MRPARPFSLTLWRASATAQGSMSRPTPFSIPSLTAAIASTPLPVPMSRTRLPAHRRAAASRLQRELDPSQGQAGRGVAADAEGRSRPETHDDIARPLRHLAVGRAQHDALGNPHGAIEGGLEIGAAVLGGISECPRRHQFTDGRLH